MPTHLTLDPALAADIASIQMLDAVPSILRVICEFTGMGYAAVARVTDDSWTACAVQDDIAFGLGPGGQLPLESTLCHEARLARRPIAFDNASVDPVYRAHHTPRIYGLQSYISVPIVRADGSYFGNLCAIDPQPHRVSDARTLAMFQLFATLIASQLESVERERAAKAELRDAHAVADLREQFIAVLGHDLRNPLGAATAAAELLVRRPSEPHGAKIGLRLARSLKRMAGLIDDVMDFARGRLGGGLGVRPEPVADLGDALRLVAQELRDAHPGREIAESIDVVGPAVCDRARVQQLLSNLVGNALTHGSTLAPVEVEARIEAGWLDILVRNQGEPIAPASLERVFEPYWRPATSAAGGGLGLGLYICSQIAKGHGGTLGATSSAQGETVFTARIPVDDPA